MNFAGDEQVRLVVMMVGEGQMPEREEGLDLRRHCENWSCQGRMSR